MVRGVHTISRVLPLMARLGWHRHHSAVYRFLAQGRWSLDSLGRVTFQLLRPWLPDTILAIVDDTLCAKSGRQVFGTGIHHDSARSVYGGNGRRLEVLTHGHLWVVLAVWVPCPWQRQKGWAIPLLFRLYRSPQRCPKRCYRRRSQLAAELIARLADWRQPDQRLRVAGDGAYCCQTVLRRLPDRTAFVGPLQLNAALYTPAVRPSGRGRPRRKGYRMASPKTRLQSKGRGWERIEIELYGRTVTVRLVSFVCVWYHAAGTHPVRVVVTRDPKRRDQGRAYVSTDPDLTPEEVLTTYARRWQLEVTFRDLKQELGFEDPRNGWWRRPAGRRDNPCRPPRHHNRGRHAVERTAPLAAVAYALIIRWYLAHGARHLDVQRVRRETPWYRHKHDVSFADMLAAVRRASWADLFRRKRFPKRFRRIFQDLWILAGNAA
jgi:hypothetical protein